jgi:hypothetical protein
VRLARVSPLSRGLASPIPAASATMAVSHPQRAAAAQPFSARRMDALWPFCPPEIVEAIVRGTQPADLTAKKLIRRTNLPLEWRAQKQVLGFR